MRPLDIRLQSSVLVPPENRHDVLDRYDKQAIVALEIDRDGVFGVEEHTVVLPDRVILVARNLGRNRNDPAGDGRNLDIARKLNTALGGLLVLVLAQQYALADRLDRFELLARAGLAHSDPRVNSCKS